MAWVCLFFAGVFEIVWAVALKYSNGFTNLVASLIVISSMIVSFYLMSISMKTIPISVVYPIWTAIGAVGVAIFGMTVLGDSVSVIKILCLFLIIVGVVGIKLFP